MTGRKPEEKGEEKRENVDQSRPIKTVVKGIIINYPLLSFRENVGHPAAHFRMANN